MTALEGPAKGGLPGQLTTRDIGHDWPDFDGTVEEHAAGFASAARLEVPP